MSMKKQYHLTVLNGELYKYVSFSLGYSRPEEYLPSLEKELARKKFQGYILFDLLLCNGFNSQRYLKSYFDGNSFQEDSFVILTDKELNSKIKEASFKFYSTQNELLDNNCLLTKAQKFLVRKGYYKNTNPTDLTNQMIEKL